MLTATQQYNKRLEDSVSSEEIQKTGNKIKIC